MDEKKRFRIMLFIVIVMAAAIVLEGLIIYKKSHQAPVAQGANTFDNFSSSLSNRLTQDQKDYDHLFDRFFNDDFFSRHHEPFSEMEKMRRQLEDTVGKQNEGIFTRSWDSWFGNRFLGSPEDIESQLNENKDSYVITLRIPNLKENKLEVKIRKDGIAVSGDFSQTAEKKDKDGNVISKSEIQRSIFKSFPIPGDANYKKAVTKSEGDKIIITLPKTVS